MEEVKVEPRVTYPRAVDEELEKIKDMGLIHSHANISVLRLLHIYNEVRFAVVHTIPVNVQPLQFITCTLTTITF